MNPLPNTYTVERVNAAGVILHRRVGVSEAELQQMADTAADLELQKSWGKVTSKVTATAGDNVPAEIEYYAENGEQIGFWAYGQLHPDYPMKDHHTAYEMAPAVVPNYEGLEDL